MSEYKFVDSDKLDNALVATASAIRDKTGSSDDISFDFGGETGFATAISEIPSGGSTFDENADICFWDFDGTPVYSCSFAEIQTATALPSAPDHSQDEVPLTFQYWNWTLAELQALTQPMDVGAVYYPTDNKLHFFYRLSVGTGLTAAFNTTQSTSFEIDWGDGTFENWGSSTENGANPTHTYENYGEYHVKISGTFTPTSNLFNSSAPQALVKGLYLCSSNNGSWLGTYWNSAASSSSIEVTTGWTGVKSMSNNSPALDATPYLKAFVLTKNCARHKFRNCYSIKLISFPPSIDFTSTDYLGSNCLSLQRIRIPSGIYGFRFAWGGTDLEFYKGPLRYKYLESAKSLRRLVVIGDIDSNALGANCPLEEIWCGLETPPTLSSTTPFSGIRKNGKIHVPAASLTTYQEASTWSTYADYMVGDWSAATEPDR